MHPNLQHILTLAHLLKFGKGGACVEITTTELGNIISRSQQSASKYLVELEKAGLLERTKAGQKFRIMITDRGVDEVLNLHETIKGSIEVLDRSGLQLDGKVVSGMGEGAYYMSLEGYRSQFNEKLGYEPYAGTLNLKLLNQSSVRMRSMMDNYPSVFIRGFTDSSRSYGWVKCYPAILNDGAVDKAAVIVLERTHYDNSMLEVIAPIGIKDLLGIKNGDSVKVFVTMTPKDPLLKTT
jgi:riboflavin kinase, archaea type